MERQVDHARYHKVGGGEEVSVSPLSNFKFLCEKGERINPLKSATYPHGGRTE